jgi:hypothetical protein
METVLVNRGIGQKGVFPCPGFLASKNRRIVILEREPNKSNIRDFPTKVEIIRGDVLDRQEITDQWEGPGLNSADIG